jgi:hypothetical protein
MSHFYRSARYLVILLTVVGVSACDYLGIGSDEQLKTLAKEEGRAVGAACRQIGRSLEDCYSKHSKTDKAAIFMGWREMQEYMKKNHLETISDQQKTDSSEENLLVSPNKINKTNSTLVPLPSSSSPQGVVSVPSGAKVSPGLIPPPKSTDKHLITSDDPFKEEAVMTAKSNLNDIINEVNRDEQKKQVGSQP